MIFPRKNLPADFATISDLVDRVNPVKRFSWFAHTIQHRTDCFGLPRLSRVFFGELSFGDFDIRVFPVSSIQHPVLAAK